MLYKIKESDLIETFKKLIEIVSCSKFYVEWWAQILANLLYSHAATTTVTNTDNNRNNMEGKCSGLPYAFPQQTLRGGIVFTKFGGKEIPLALLTIFLLPPILLCTVGFWGSLKLCLHVLGIVSALEIWLELPDQLCDLPAL